MNLTVWSNIPNPYNQYLYRSLRTQGVDVEVFYASEPQSRGRPWSIPLDPHEAIAGTLRSEWRSLQDAATRSTAVISGGYLGKTETARRLLIPRRVEHLWFWGERLKPREALAPYRRWYFKPFEGMFAIGSWARPSYEALARPGQTVHTLPYTTAVRQVTRKPSETPLIGFAGSLIERKGVDLLLRGLAELPRHRRPRLEVVGSGPLRPQLEQIGVDHGLDVDWLGELGSSASDEHRASWWAQAVPSRYDGWGVVVSEAMASGVPAIVSRHVGAGHDLVRDGFNGTLVDDDAAWPAALARYGDPAIVETEGTNAHRVGSELSSARAATWLRDVLSVPDGPPRDFVAESWERVHCRGSA